MSNRKEAIEKVLRTLESRFRSGNDVPVTRNHINREEYEVIHAAMTRVLEDLDREEAKQRWWFEVQSLGVNSTEGRD